MKRTIPELCKHLQELTPEAKTIAIDELDRETMQEAIKHLCKDINDQLTKLENPSIINSQ